MKRNLYIQGLRGILALSVLIFHVIYSGLPTFKGELFSHLTFFFQSFGYAVEIFFGVSGIVILQAYKKSISLQNFFIDRVSRIFPVLWVTVTIIFILGSLANMYGPEVNFLVFAGNLFALPPLMPIKLIHPAAWTISYEFMFYLLFIVFGLLRVRLNKNLVWFIITFAAFSFFFFHVRAIMFFIGIGVAYYVNKNFSRLKYFKYSGLALAVSFLSWHSGALMLGGTYEDLPTLLRNPAATALFSIGTIFAFFALLGIFNGNGIFCRLLVTPACQWLGIISFSFYMWHSIVLAIIKAGMYKSGLVIHLAEYSQLAFFLLALPPTLLISKFSQEILEKRATNFLRKYAEKNIIKNVSVSNIR